MEIIIITGLSGAGKSLASDCLEDLGYYCIDNMPPGLIGNFVDLIGQSKQKVDKAAFVTDVRGGMFFGDLKEKLSALKERGIDYKVIFFDATDDALIRRYSEHRRAHPLGEGRTYEEAIQAERVALEPIRRIANYTIDTTDMKNADLAVTIESFVSEDGGIDEFKVVVQSFGYKYGIPAEADIVFDMRFIPNPFYVDSLRHLTGKSRKVRDYVMRAPEASGFMSRVIELFYELKPAYIREGKRGLNISFGCTGGQHRSVATAIIIFKKLTEKDENVVLKHRDV
jgi:UPF0042 nucleotide-binding protein